MEKIYKFVEKFEINRLKNINVDEILFLIYKLYSRGIKLKLWLWKIIIIIILIYIKEENLKIYFLSFFEKKFKTLN